MTAQSNPQIDPLTGLPNRKAFLEAFETALTQARPGDAPLSIAFLDIDNFLRINDRYSHAGGDAVLLGMIEVIRRVCGGQVVVGRLGGDEFGLLFAGVEREQAFLTMERLRAEIEQAQFPLASGGEPVEHVTISAGIASFPMDGRLKSELLRKADQALYRVKLAGRNKIRLAYEERMTPKTTHYTQTQLERLTKLAAERQAGEAELLREALDELLIKYGLNDIER